MSVSEIEVTNACDAVQVKTACPNTFFSIRLMFRDQSQNPVTLDALPEITIVDARAGAYEGTKVSAQPMTATGTTGLYEYVVNLDDYREGLYTVSATGTIGGLSTRAEAAFQVYAPTIEQMLIHRVKSRLHDLEEQLLKLDLPVPKWSEDAIFQELVNGLQDLNGKAPMFTNYDFRTCPRQDLLVLFAFAYSLLSGGILENWNTYTMSDGSANLTLNRAGFLRDVARDSLTRYDAEADKFKKALRPRIKGQGTALFPLQIRRAIGFLPNMKQVFGP